ncbi:hypothetical protein STIAU_7231, partial [Stigmatella aurantiaca DW4/3-1]
MGPDVGRVPYFAVVVTAWDVSPYRRVVGSGVASSGARTGSAVTGAGGFGGLGGVGAAGVPGCHCGMKLQVGTSATSSCGLPAPSGAAATGVSRSTPRSSHEAVVSWPACTSAPAPCVTNSHVAASCKGSSDSGGSSPRSMGARFFSSTGGSSGEAS